MKLVLLGPPGTGKGTIAEFIEVKLACRHISTGDLLRQEVAKKSGIGKEIEPVMNAGKLVDDAIVLKLLKSELKGGNGSFILDGFPRTLEQGKLLDSLLQEMGISLDAVLEIDSPDELIVKRLSARKQCAKCGRIYGLDVPPKNEGVCDDCGLKVIVRKDDSPKIVRKRLALYKEITQPLSGFYREKSLLIRVDGNRSLQEIFSEVEKLLSAFSG
ncbi:MAG TPA: adenylate kinase [archaeon]|nr:adenylate kinase [archaeon]